MHSYHGKNPYVFFSYCHEDQKEVFEIAEKMYDMRYRVWYDKALEAEKPFDDDIADHIKACDVFIIFLSKHYLDSPYCDMELKFAVENERKCFAIYLDNVDLSNHSGMAMCLRTSNNIYRKNCLKKNSMRCCCILLFLMIAREKRMKMIQTFLSEKHYYLLHFPLGFVCFCFISLLLFRIFFGL